MSGQYPCSFCGEVDFHPYMIERVWSPDDPVGWICKKCFTKLSVVTHETRSQDNGELRSEKP